MADQKISQLPTITGANMADNDKFVLVDTSGDTTVATTRAEFFKSVPNVTFGDNDKAIFGAGSDLQIYHDGSNSYVSDVGAGDLIIDSNGNAIRLKGTNGENMIVADTDASVKLFHDGSEKLATTSTGIDVTGTVTADGLTVDGIAEISSTTPTLRFFETDQIDEGTLLRSAGDSFQIAKMLDTGAADGIRFAIDQSSGDISFYEDTGTTAKFFWDASAESLGIGTSSPSATIDVVSSGTNSQSLAEFSSASGLRAKIASDGSDDGYMYLYDANDANTVSFRTDGNNSFINGGGNFGIGTSSPAYPLEVQSGGVGTVLRAGTSSVSIDSVGSESSPSLIFNGDSNTGIWRPASDTLAVSTAGTERMRIDSSGNVGIGTSSPAEELDISADAPSMQLSSTNASGRNYGLQSTNSGAFSFYDGTVGLERMRIDSSGNLLVGTTTSIPAGSSQNVTGIAMQADGQLHVSADGQFAGVFNRKTSDGEIIQFRKDGTTVGSIGSVSGVRTYIETPTRSGLEFDTPYIAPRHGGSLSDNFVNLGYSGARFKDLHLSGNANVERVFTTHDGDWGMEMKGITSARLRFHTSAGGSGQVGAITVSTSTTTYATSSDYRLKENVVDLTGASARVNQLNPSRFNFIADGTDTAVDGFLAHEVATVVPEAITGTKDAMMDEEYEVTPAVLDDDGNVTTEAVMGTRSVPDYQGIDQSKLVPLLTAALQEALTKIDAMETRLTALEG